jgi:bifunctional UDP-N-acetylglucosamine pyrophosphorylase/glucosamine-1-phosphate N-acetyltransferase
VGDGCEIGPDTRLVDSVVGDGAVVEHAVVRESDIGPGARVGPYAALAPQSKVPSDFVTGPFYTGGTGRRAETER